MSPLQPLQPGQDPTFEERHPILKQIRDDALQLSKEQVLLPCGYGDGDFHRGFGFRGAAINQRLMNRASLEKLAPKPPMSNLKLEKVSIVGVKGQFASGNQFSPQDRILNEHDGRGERDGKAAIIEFANEAAAGSVAEIEKAKAIPTYQQIGGDDHLTVGHGAWLGCTALTVSFSVGDTERLIVAVQLNETGGWPTTYEGHNELDTNGISLVGYVFSPIKRRLNGAVYRVKVQIVNRVNVQRRGIESVGEGELLGEYLFRLKTSPLEIETDKTS